MSLKLLVKDYVYKNRLTRGQFCKKAGISICCYERMMRGEGLMMANFKKIVQAVDYEIHLKPKSHNPGAPNNGSGISQQKANAVSENK
jgi:predicted transcriptional regulator